MTISTVNASYVDMDDTSISNSTDVNLLKSVSSDSVDVNKELLQASENDEILTADVSIGTYSDLITLIKATDSGDTLYLEKDYAYDESVDSAYVKGININKLITIDGQGHRINGMNKSAIMNVNVDNVIIRNITMTNTTMNYHVLAWYGNNGKIYDSIFKDSTSLLNDTTQIEGVAIHWFGNDGYMSNLWFENITGWRGAISNSGIGLQVINSTFTKCISTDQGCAAYLRGETLFKGCKFINLKSNNCLIANDGGLNVIIDNCTFKNFTAGIFGYDGPYHITNCIFENYVANNTVTRYNYFIILAQGSNVINCTFKNITILKDTGFIYAPGLNIISNCNFDKIAFNGTPVNNVQIINVVGASVSILNCNISNSNRDDSVLIRVNGEQLIFKNNIIYNNVAPFIINGTASANKITISNCNIHDNDLTSYGFNFVGGTTVVEDSIFTNNNGKTKYSTGNTNPFPSFSLVDEIYISPTGTKDGSSSSKPTNLTYALSIIKDQGTIYFTEGTYNVGSLTKTFHFSSTYPLKLTCF